MSRALDAYMRQYPDASVAQVRKFTYELMQDALPNFTDIAETLSCDFIEALAEEYGWDDVQPEIADTTDYNLVDKRLHYLAGHLANGDVERYRDGVLDVTRFYIKRSAHDAMVANCDKANLRYARVPSGFETCAFCFMLASRGFVYSSELKAGLGHSYHPNCNCTIVPGAEGRTSIDGYDPKGMYKRWEACAKTIGAYDADSVMKEVSTRDWHWLYTGEAPIVDYSKSSRIDYGRLVNPGNYKPNNIINRGKEWRDIVVHDTLSANGLRVEARSAKGVPENYKHVDLLINGQLWEVKSPENTKPGDPIPKDPLNFIKDNFKKASSQFKHQWDAENNVPLDYSGPRRVVLNMTYRNVEINRGFINRVIAEAESQHIDEVMLVLPGDNDGIGTILRIK